MKNNNIFFSNKIIILLLIIGFSAFIPKETIAQGLIYTDNCVSICIDQSIPDSEACKNTGLLGAKIPPLEEVLKKDACTVAPENCKATDKQVCCCQVSVSTDPNDYWEVPRGEKPKYEIPELQIKLPINFGKVECVNDDKGGFSCSVSWIGDYINFIYRYGLSVAGILAALMLMAGGIIWLTSGGDSGKVSKAKNLITGSITGLLILFSTYLILFQINPNLVNLNPITIGERGATDNNFDNVISTNKTYIEVDEVYRWDYEGEENSIKKQVGDASPELAAFINCMSKNLPNGVGRISSISDSNHIGNLLSCEKRPCSGCAHSCGSCHYGGGLGTNKSYAVDYGDEENKNELVKAANKCGVYQGGPGYIENEGDHLHMSVPACPRK